MGSHESEGKIDFIVYPNGTTLIASLNKISSKRKNYRVFLSYSHEDYNKAKVIANIFEKEFLVLWDKNLITGEAVGNFFFDQIVVYAVIISSNSINSEWIKNELLTAIHSCTVIPILIEDIEMPNFLSHIDTIDLSSWSGQGDDPIFSKLILDISLYVQKGTKLEHDNMDESSNLFGISNRFLNSSLLLLCKGKFESLGAFPTEYLDLPLCKGATPLCCAICQHDDQAVRTLLFSGANPNKPDLRGATPFIYAAQSNQVLLGKMLIDAGADVDTVDQNGRSAVHYALYIGHVSFTNFLIEQQADFGIIDVDGRSALDYARSIAEKKEVKTLNYLALLGGCTESSDENKTVSPMRADPDYVRLDTLHRVIDSKDFLQLKLPFFIMLVFFGSAFLPSQVGLPHFHSGITFLLSVFLSFLFFAQPLLSCTKKLQFYSKLGYEDVSIEQSIKSSNTSARAISGILKHTSRLVYRELSNDKTRYDWGAELLSVLTMTLTLIPALLMMPVELYFTLIHDFFILVGELDEWKNSIGSTIWITVPAAILMFFVGIFMIFIIIVIIIGFIYLVLGLIPHWLAIHIVKKKILQHQRLQAQLVANYAHNLEDETNLKESVLYLRSFNQDGACKIGEFGLESLLVYCLSKVCPVVAVGFSDTLLGPTNIHATSEDWEEKVIKLSRDAGLIVMIPYDSKGVLWEIDLLQQKGYLDKTVFVAPPINQEGTTGQDWERMRRHSELVDLEIPPYCDAGFVFRLNTDGKFQSSGPLGLDVSPPLQAPKQGYKSFDNDDDYGDDAGSEGDGSNSPSQQQQQYTTLQNFMQSVPILTNAEFMNVLTNDFSSENDGGDGGDGGGGVG